MDKCKFQVGMRARAKVRTLGGWMGTGTVQDVRREGGEYVVNLIRDDDRYSSGYFSESELAVMRDQTPFDPRRVERLHSPQR